MLSLQSVVVVIPRGLLNTLPLSMTFFEQIYCNKDDHGLLRCLQACLSTLGTGIRQFRHLHLHYNNPARLEEQASVWIDLPVYIAWFSP